MKKRTKNILVIVGIISVIFIGAFGYGVYSLYSFFKGFGGNREIPDEIKQARILKGGDFLAKKEFFRVEPEGLIKTIGKSSSIEDEKERQKAIGNAVGKGIYNFADLKIVNNELIAVSEAGGYVFDFDGNLKREILFEPVKEKIKIGWYEQDSYQSRTDNLRIVELEKNKLGFLSFGSVQGVRIFNENGNEIWNYGKEEINPGSLFADEKEREKSYEKSTHVLEAAVGDLDNDGIAEYIVAKKNDGIRAFDQSGNEKWFQADKFPGAKLYVFDIDGDGKNELLGIGVNPKIRDADGNIIRKIQGGGDNDALLLPENKQLPAFCNIRANKTDCEDENGQSVFRADAPLSKVNSKEKRRFDLPNDTESVAYPKAVRVNLIKNTPKYLAVVASFIGIPRSHFYLYDEKGNLVYHELLDEDAETIAVIPAANGNEEIVIGGKNTIWRYAVN